MQQDQLFENIFGRKITEWDNKSFLQTVIEEHPYFAAAHFYALKKLDKLNDNYKEAAAITALFFDNPFLLQLQLDDNSSLSAAQNTFVEKHLLQTKNIEENKEEPTEMLFEPLHATDYFASQGIKLMEAISPDDKLGIQLKSFTSWLKTMKKVYPDKLAQVTAAIETAVQNLAEKSNVEANIITEAMAEVYIQQNKLAKAEDIYHKLSLQNPTKSAYFAAKIELLKN